MESQRKDNGPSNRKERRELKAYARKRGAGSTTAWRPGRAVAAAVAMLVAAASMSIMAPEEASARPKRPPKPKCQPSLRLTKSWTRWRTVQGFVMDNRRGKSPRNYTFTVTKTGTQRYQVGLKGGGEADLVFAKVRSEVNANLSKEMRVAMQATVRGTAAPGTRVTNDYGFEILEFRGVKTDCSGGRAKTKKFSGSGPTRVGFRAGG
ncbi:MAG TPA: hypothetical protein VK988_22190 [Acidimicrobiales bacterium]|nr:hypothetical protein [Acidimicrobiales bacterium]